MLYWGTDNENYDQVSLNEILVRLLRSRKRRGF